MFSPSIYADFESTTKQCFHVEGQDEREVEGALEAGLGQVGSG